jgi:uncharacterized protein YutE (UPF0331/DUF86 family)
VVDKVLLAAKTAAIRDAVARVREMLPSNVDAFLEDRTVREVVILNVFLAIQEAIALATHWLADAGWEVPQTQGDAFSALAAQRIIDPALAGRLRAAAGLRNLIAHQYGVLDLRRVFAIASNDLDDLLALCQELAHRAGPA